MSKGIISAKEKWNSFQTRSTENLKAGPHKYMLLMTLPFTAAWHIADDGACTVPQNIHSLGSDIFASLDVCTNKSSINHTLVEKCSTKSMWTNRQFWSWPSLCHNQSTLTKRKKKKKWKEKKEEEEMEGKYKMGERRGVERRRRKRRRE